ncbi:hypothetical protein JCM33374_g4493 [Metschnikowia sp. JCM 33374]|nr:hypothetical protein JCM33374_g4493 [Metschnikowia sp. JCM 33374]
MTNAIKDHHKVYLKNNWGVFEAHKSKGGKRSSDALVFPEKLQVVKKKSNNFKSSVLKANKFTWNYLPTISGILKLSWIPLWRFAYRKIYNMDSGVYKGDSMGPYTFYR